MATQRFPSFLALAALAGASTSFAQDANESRVPADPARLLQPVRRTPLAGAQALSSAPGRTIPLFTNVATAANSQVPGHPGIRFDPAAGNEAFERPWISPDGLHYAIAANTTHPSTEDEVLIRDGVVVIREGTQAPWAAPGELCGPFHERLDIDNAADLLFRTNTGPTFVDDDYAVRVTAAPAFSIVARESGAIAALPGASWSSLIDGPVLTSLGTLLHGNEIENGPVTPATNEIVVLGATIVAQQGVTVPSGQAGGADAWENFDFEQSWVDASGTNVLLLGDLLGAVADDKVATWNGAVVLQEGTLVPGSSFASPVGALTGAALDPGSNWYVRGNNADGQGWVVRNGAVVHRVGDAVATAGERVLLTGTLSEANEVPPSGAAGTGTIAILIDTATNTLTYEVAHMGLAPGLESMAHIHGPAAAGANAGILYALPLGALKTGRITYLESEENWFLTGLTYVNVHTDLAGAGAIRGQCLPATEEWDNTLIPAVTSHFIAQAGNAAGEFAVIGGTNGPRDANWVVALTTAERTYVIAREGDPVDADGNGLFDDGLYLNTFGDDDLRVLPDGSVMYVATLRASPTGTTTVQPPTVAQGLFLRERDNLQRSLCYGDGLGTACPCGNHSPVGQRSGCMNSLGMGGKLDASGIASVANDSLALLGSGMPNGSALYFQGTVAIAAAEGTAFGDGLRCVAGSQRRFAVQLISGFASTYPGVGDNPVSIAGAIPGAGAVRYYQVWYRNAAVGFCTADTFNLSNAAQIVWGP